MFKDFSATMRSHQEVCTTHTDGHHNISESEIAASGAFRYSELFPNDNKPTSERAIVTLKELETRNTSKRNFYLVVNDIGNDKIGEDTHKASSAASRESSCEKRLPKTIDQEVFDTDRSEEFVKHFIFDTSEYNNDTGKCIAFWKALKKTGIQPVKCTLIEPNSTKKTQKRVVNNLKGGVDEEIEAEAKEEDDSVEQEKMENKSSERGSSMWYRALVRLQRRKMDEVAFAATSKQCRLCEPEESYREFRKKQHTLISETELDNNTKDIICLNDWKPNQVKTVSRTTQRQVEADPISLQQKLVSDNSIRQPTNTNEEAEQEKDKEEVSHKISECQCRKERCRCNKVSTRNPSNIGFADSEHMYTLNSEMALQEDMSKQSTKECICQKECVCQVKQGEETPQTPTYRKCEICRPGCCWEHKINLSKKFLDDLRYEMHSKEIKRNEASQLFGEDEEMREEDIRGICVICGHDDCNCKGPEKQICRKYFQSIEFDDSVITPLQQQKEKLAKQNVFHQELSKKYSKDSMHEMCGEDSSFKELENTEGVDKKPEVLKAREVHVSRKLLIKPRPEKIANKKNHMLEIDRYGIPQVVRYANGKLGPKRVTSKDILSTSTEYADN